MRSQVYTLKLQFRRSEPLFGKRRQKNTYLKGTLSEMAKVYLSFKPHDFLCCGTKKSREEEIGQGKCNSDKKQTDSGSCDILLPGLAVQFTAEVLPNN